MADMGKLTGKSFLLAAVDLASTEEGAEFLAQRFEENAKRLGFDKIPQVADLTDKLHTHATAVAETVRWGFNNIWGGVVPIRPGDAVEQSAETPAETAQALPTQAVEQVALEEEKAAVEAAETQPKKDADETPEPG
jgi:hypothetical protein